MSAAPSFEEMVATKLDQKRMLPSNMRGDMPSAVWATHRVTRREVIAERLVEAAERGRPWAMQVLCDRVFPKVTNIEATVMTRSWVEIVQGKQEQLREIVAGGLTLEDLPTLEQLQLVSDVVDVTPEEVTQRSDDFFFQDEGEDIYT